MFNGYLLVDWFPLDDENKFRVTAGIFYGPARIAKITTDGESAATLSCIAAYNKKYFKVDDDNEILEWGLAGAYMGTYGHDVVDTDGTILHKTGDTYLMMPDLFWGGYPSLRVSTDGIDLMRDIDNIPGQKGDYIKKIKKFVVFPNIGISVIYHLF